MPGVFFVLSFLIVISRNTATVPTGLPRIEVMISRKFLALALLVFTHLRVFAGDAALPMVIDITYKKYVLKNGLTLIVHEDHKAPIVAVNVWYHVGSKNEKPGRTGFAHLF